MIFWLCKNATSSAIWFASISALVWSRRSLRFKSLSLSTTLGSCLRLGRDGHMSLVMPTLKCSLQCLHMVREPYATGECWRATQEPFRSYRS